MKFDLQGEAERARLTSIHRRIVESGAETPEAILAQLSRDDRALLAKDLLQDQSLLTGYLQRVQSARHSTLRDIGTGEITDGQG